MPKNRERDIELTNIVEFFAAAFEFFRIAGFLDNTTAAFSCCHIVKLGFATRQVIVVGVRVIRVSCVGATLTNGHDVVVAALVDSNVVGKAVAELDVIAL